MYSKKDVDALQIDWNNNPRWQSIKRNYTAENVVRLRGSNVIDYPLARLGAEKLWHLFKKEPFIRSMGALTGNQAVQLVQAGIKAIYISGWQVAADANDALQTYPDQSLYPFLSVPHLLTRINNALARSDQIEHMQNKEHTDWFVPLVADAEAGFGGPLNTFELIKAMITAGAAAIHLEDQLSSLKKCGHMGGKVLESTSICIEKLNAARFASDVLNVPTLIIARTDAEAATFIRSDADPVDKPFITGERSSEGFFHLRHGIEYAITRGNAFAPYADLVWCETSRPNLEEARLFSEGIHAKFPGKWLAYNCSPSFNWKKHLNEEEITTFQEKLGNMGYKFQFITLAGFHTINGSMFELAHEYQSKGMAAYAKFQQREFELEQFGYKAIKHQSFVGAGYYDELLDSLYQGQFSTHALKGSTEEAQF